MSCPQENNCLLFQFQLCLTTPLLFESFAGTHRQFRRAIAIITEETLQNVSENIDNGLLFVVGENGGHLKTILN